MGRSSSTCRKTQRTSHEVALIRLPSGGGAILWGDAAADMRADRAHIHVRSRSDIRGDNAADISKELQRSMECGSGWRLKGGLNASERPSRGAAPHTRAVWGGEG